MAMLWIPAAQGQKAAAEPQGVTWMGRLLAIPAGTFHTSAKHRRSAFCTTAKGRLGIEWIPSGLRLWPVASMTVLHFWRHGSLNKTVLISRNRPGNGPWNGVQAGGVQPPGRLIPVLAARPPPPTL
jgi:hypothetical protein